MKLIDLLIKISNLDENLPKEIEILGFHYVLEHSTHMPNYFKKENQEISIEHDLSIIQCLTDKITIIEE